MLAHDNATVNGAEQALNPVWYNSPSLALTPEDVRAICEKHLTEVYIDWSSVPFNLAIRSGIEAESSALGIKLLRITNSSFEPSGMAGDLAGVLPLHPNIIETGGPVSPEQFAAIIAPALKEGVDVSTWGVGSTTLKMGQNEPLKGLVAYDWYGLGLQLAAAVHKAYPNGTTVGYIHWVNNAEPLLTRELGFLNGLKEYRNIKVESIGQPSPSNPASGFTNYNAAEAFTIAFLDTHPNVKVLFAPWEDPPALGEAAAIQSQHLTGKVHIATMDFGDDGAAQIRHNGTISVDMAEDVYDGGRMMVLTAALAEIGKDSHPYVIVPTFAVTKSDVIQAWSFMHGPNVACPTIDCG